MSAIRSKTRSRRGGVPSPVVDSPGHPRVKVDLSKFKKRDYIVGNSDDLVHMDWSGEWSEMQNLQPLPHGHGSEGEKR